MKPYLRPLGMIMYLILQMPCFLQGQGIIYGVVTDGGLKEPLAFANVGISALGIGTTTDLDGRYRLTNVPEGTQLVEFSYLGYESQSEEIIVLPDREVELSITLTEEGVTIEEVVVVGQATGQRAAINQQINSNTIVNVVSKEKLQELPDQNAAEAVGRLAGVSVLRDAGEGQRIAIRGISPRFNAITINGERLPSTEESERSVDLSMISPDMLDGIELFKAITPDMDGDAVGGTVNFTVRKADAGFRSNIRMLTGYNSLKDDFGQYRGNVSISNRFLDKRLGLVATGNFQRANRSSEFLLTDYVYGGVNSSDQPILNLEDLNLGDRQETRYRYGGSLTLDYDLNKDHSILLNSSLGRTDRDELRFRKRYRIGNNYQELDVRERERHITLLTNSLSGTHHIKNFRISWRSSYSQSDQQTPFQLTGRFRELAAIGDAIENERDLSSIPKVFKHNLENTIMRDSRYNETHVDENRFTSKLDLQYNFATRNGLNGYFKVGSKYRHVNRNRDVTGLLIRPYLAGDNPATTDPTLFVTNQANQILLANFIGDYTNAGFLNGDYDILPGTETIRNTVSTPLREVDIARYNELFGTSFGPGDALHYYGHIDPDKVERFFRRFRSEYIRDPFAASGDYHGRENILASYAMAELNVGKKLTLLGGIRMEHTDQEYTSTRIAGSLEEEEIDDLVTIINTAGRSYTEWLPMAHLKYKAFSWVDLRAAVTKTMARPNFFNIVPWEYYNTSEAELAFGNPDLLHTTAWNYDLFLSFYNRFGLFTIGGFYKELANIDFIGRSTITDPNDDFKGFSLTEPRNTPDLSTVKGVEFDLQANFRSLDNWLRGIVVGGNITFADSKTFYPLFNVETVFVGPPTFFQTVVTDTVRTGPIVGQADMLANLSLGYEIGGFSGRISMVYQSDALAPGNEGVGNAEPGVGEIPEKDYFDQSFFRFDLALKQRLDRKGNWTLLFNMNNITNTPERAFLGIADRLIVEETYGFTADIGITYKFKRL